MALVPRSAAVCALALAALASPAVAGPPGTWTDLNQADSNITRVSAARDNGILNILWSNDESVLNTQISSNAQNVSGPQTVFVYTDGVAGPTALLPVPGGRLRAFFSGLTPPDDNPHTVGMSTATSDDGVSWAVQPTLASDARTGMRSPVYVAAGIAGTLFANGTPLSIWGDSAPNAHGYHVGTSNQTPDIRYGSGGASVGGPGAATDSATGEVAIAYADLATGRTQARFVQQTTNPWFPPGPILDTPGGQAPDAAHPTHMTGRSNGAGGIFVSYLRGDNGFSSRPAVWRIGADNPMKGLPGARGVRYMGVTMGLDKRLWAFWARRPSVAWRVYGARSNRKATRFGQAVAIKPPGGAAATVFALEGEGTAPGGMLDLIALVQTSQNDTDNYHQRIRPGITLLYKVIDGGQHVRFKTRDAGAKLATTIHYGGKTKNTGSDGVIEMDAKPGKHVATATRDGYHPRSRVVKVPQP